MYAFMITCEREGRYCGNAQRELQQTQDFIERKGSNSDKDIRLDRYAT